MADERTTMTEDQYVTILKTVGIVAFVATVLFVAIVAF